MDATHRTTGRPNRAFLHHYLEMVVVMLVSMAVLGAIAEGIFVLFGHANLYHYAGFRAFIMTVDMVIGMTVWMRYRGHGWAATSEMAAAMALPFVLLIGPYLADVLSRGALFTAMHVLMLPFMALVMLRRREEYSQSHKLHVPFRHASSHA
jgi:hypothetical protein